MTTATPTPQPQATGHVAFWYAETGLPARRAALPGDLDADVCIIGAGYTGLWTAFYLNRADPDLEIVILEREFAGFGGSGRNGGWLSGGFSWSHRRYAASSGEPAVREMVKAMNGTVDEVIAVAEAEGIDADILRTDELMIATNPAQQARMLAEIDERRRWGEEDRVFHLDGDALAARLRIPGALGALGVRNVARIQPAKLVRGLAAAVERRGIRIHEGTAVERITPGAAITAGGRVRAPVILRCTEGFTAGLHGLRREWLPLNSAQIVTPPLPQEVWDEIGWQRYEIVGDFANSYCYCQRTADGRLVVGGRGVPYRFASHTDHEGAPDNETIRRLFAILKRHFPRAAPFGIAHAWCGVLGVPRDWCATVGFDPASGLGWAGGYVGTGVSTSNLAGRTLAELVSGKAGALSRLPWVNRRVRRWEPEPLRWIGLRGMYALLDAADRREARSGTTRPSRLAALASRIAGRN